MEPQVQVPRSGMNKKGVFFFSLVLVFAFSNSAFAKELCPFHGEIDLLNKRINLAIGKEEHSSITADVVYLGDGNYKIHLALNHLKTSIFEISTQLESSMLLVHVPVPGGDKNGLKGNLLSHYSILNLKPVDELSGNFEIREQILYLPDLEIGRVSVKGYLELFYPYKFNFSCSLNEIPMKDFLSFWINSQDLDAQGSVRGQIQIAGIPNQFFLKGDLETYQGRVNQFPFESIVLNLEGQYPVLHIVKSTVTQADGMSFNLDGQFDLSNQEDFQKEIAALQKSQMVSDHPDQWEWTIKQRKENGKSASEFKYFLKKDHTSPLKEESDVLGVEQKIKF